MLFNILYRVIENKQVPILTRDIYNFSKYANKYLSKRYIHIHEPFIHTTFSSGRLYLTNNHLNKDLAFSMDERFALGLNGLLPPTVLTLEKQVEICKVKIDRFSKNINKYLYLMDILAQNEKLFYRLLADHLDELMPIVYTPTVGEACQKYGIIYRPLNALFITINDKGHIYDILRNWPEQFVTAIVVTDGERILGLGDLGVNGVCIPVGKMSLYTVLGGVQPHLCMPVILDVGTNNQELLDDPLYKGVRQKRVTGAEYESFVDEFLQAVVDKYTRMIIIQFEDFSTRNAFKFLERYKYKYRVFNDDIQGTAGIILAGLYSAQRIIGKKLSQHKYVFFGAGGANLGTANLLVKVMMEHEGLTLKDARSLIWMFDVDGLLCNDRKNVSPCQMPYAKDHAPCDVFEDLINELRPSVLIGASTVKGAFSPTILQAMASFTERPIIFALSNPTNLAECTAEEAYRYTDGRAIFSSGSPFPEVVYKDQVYRPRQANNCYIFPGVALGAIMSGIQFLTNNLIILAAKAVSDLVTENDLKYGSLYPPLSISRELSVNIAISVFDHACATGRSTIYPEPKDKRAYVQQYLYNFEYEQILPKKWVYPKPPHVAVRQLDTSIYLKKK